MEVERVKITELTADPANVRKHNEKNMAAIKASLRRFGQQKPVVVDSSGVVRAGNGTLAAAIALGWSHIDIVRTELQGSEATAYAIADNRTAELAEWDADALAQTMAALEIEDEKLARDAGFSAEDVAAMALSKKPIHEDEVPEPPATPITKPGDAWLLGKHRVMCGDSADPNCVDRLLAASNEPSLITDPPYGVEFEGHSASTLTWSGFKNDDGTLDLSPILRQFRVVVSFGANCYPAQLPHRGRWIVWDKRCNENADRMLGSPFELAWTSLTSGFDRIYRIQHGGAVNADKSKERRVHPTQKPVQLMAAVVRDYAAGDVVDLFLGSGTTLIACEQLGRTCYGMEISPQYCDVIVQRWEKLTGKKAVLESRA